MIAFRGKVFKAQRPKRGRVPIRPAPPSPRDGSRSQGCVMISVVGARAATDRGLPPSDGPDRPRKVSLKKSASMVNHPAEDRDPKKVVHLNRVQIGERIYVADGIKEYYAATVDGFSCAMKEIPCQSADPSSSDLQKVRCMLRPPSDTMGAGNHLPRELAAAPERHQVPVPHADDQLLALVCAALSTEPASVPR